LARVLQDLLCGQLRPAWGMGDSASKAPCAVVDSPSGSGLKSLVSGPLDELLTFEQFWEFCEKQARTGVAGAASHEVTDLDDGGFEVRDVLSGGLLQDFELKLFNRYKFDKEKKEWTTQVFDRSFDDSQLREVITIKELSSPMRIEAWTEVAKWREPGCNLVGVLSGILGQVLIRAGVDSGNPVCKEDVDSMDGKPCAVSEALDASITPDEFWALYVAFIKGGIGKGGIKEHRVKELDACNFMVIDSFDGLVAYEKFAFDAGKDMLVSYTHENDEALSEASCIDSYTTKVHRDPLRVEFYKDVRPGRKTPCRLHRVIQEALDSCIKGTEERSAWFG